MQWQVSLKEQDTKEYTKKITKRPKIAQLTSDKISFKIVGTKNRHFKMKRLIYHENIVRINVYTLDIKLPNRRNDNSIIE